MEPRASNMLGKNSTPELCPSPKWFSFFSFLNICLLFICMCVVYAYVFILTCVIYLHILCTCLRVPKPEVWKLPPLLIYLVC